MKCYYLTGPAPLYTNSYVVVSDAGHAVVIDPACPFESYRHIISETASLPRYVLCTPGHFDHVGTAERLCSVYGAELRCGAADLNGDRLFPLTAAQDYTDGEEIVVDDLTFRVITTPGHSMGSVCILCGDKFFTGDTLFCGDTGRTDLPGGSHEEMIRTMRKLQRLRLPADTAVLPGHDVYSTYGEQMAGNEFILMYCPTEEA